MPRRALINEENSDNDDDGSVLVENSQQSTPSKRRRVDERISSLGVENNVLLANDSGFSSSGRTSPNDAVDLSSLFLNFKDEPPVAGVIKSLRLKNFMCHGNLEVTLDKNVNFITGRNGSGKSAILAALVLGLGGKPGSLNRGNAIKEYVKTGNASAEISITFNNTGVEAYRPEIYGGQITVERTIFAAGRSTYKIKGLKGKGGPVKMDEINSMLRCFNFQLNNPVMILTQDTSRTFLAQCNPKRLYEIYYRGTQLQKMDEDFEVVRQNQDLMIDAVQRRQQIIAELEVENDALDQKIRAHEDAHENRERLSSLAKEVCWAKVRDAEKAVTVLEGELEKLQEREAEALAKLNVAKANETEADSRIETETGELDALKATFENVRQQVAVFYRKVEDTDKIGRQKQVTYKKIEAEIAQLTKEKNELQNIIRSIQEKQMDDAPRKLRDQKERQVVEIKNNRLQGTATVQSHQKELVQLQNNSAAFRTQKDGMMHDLDQVKRQLNGVRMQINNLQMSKSNRLARFGPEIPRLDQLINDAVNRRQFQRRPRGPLGQYISLKDDRWGVAVEACLGNLLRAYVCHNHADQRLLEQLMRSAGIHKGNMPTIFNRDFGDETRTYDVSRNETTSEKYPNILSVLKVDDTVVRNLLIDQRRVETVVLFDNEREMREVMRRQTPTNASSAYDIAGGNAIPKPTFRFYPAHSQGGGARYLVKSVDDQLIRLEQHVQQLEADRSRLEGAIAEVQRQLMAAEQERTRCNNVIIEHQRRIQEEDRMIRRLEQEINDLLPANTNIGMMEKELEETDAKLEQARGALEEARIDRDAYGKVIEEAASHWNKKKKDEKAAEGQFLERQKQIDRLSGDKNRKKNEVERKQRAYDEIAKVTKFESERLGRQRQMAKGLFAEAKELCEERIDTGRDCTTIEREMKRIEAHLRLFDQNSEDFNGLVATRQKTEERLKTVKEYLDEIEKTVNAMAEAMRIRKTGYRTIKGLTAIVVKQRFLRYLANRNYSGKLDIDENEKTLTIFVEPRPVGAKDTSSLQAQQGRRPQKRGADKENRTQDLRGLSGGERSFSTVSFILALWETMDAPSCSLDEFDVFMDQCSRRIIMEHLIIFALQTRPSNQFIFFTPLSVSELPFGLKGLNVVQLKAPRDRE